MAAFRHGDVVVGIEADEIREMSLGNDRALLRTRDDTCVTATVTNLAAGLGRSMYKHNDCAPRGMLKVGRKRVSGPYCFRLAQKATGCCSPLTDIPLRRKHGVKMQEKSATSSLSRTTKSTAAEKQQASVVCVDELLQRRHGGVNCPSPAKLVPAELREKSGPMMHVYSTWVRALASVSCISKCQGIKPLSTPH